MSFIRRLVDPQRFPDQTLAHLYFERTMRIVAADRYLCLNDCFQYATYRSLVFDE